VGIRDCFAALGGSQWHGWGGYLPGGPPGKRHQRHGEGIPL